MASSDAPEAAFAPAPAGAPVTTSPRRVRVIVVRADERVEEVVARHPGAVPSFNRTLRIALAMRGGVSLAVWIGGAVAELDLLRRIRLYDDHTETLALVPETPASPLTPALLARVQAYAEMLDASGYDRVEFDLLAGASAGGLNAVVYAVAQRAGSGLEGLLDTWGRVGGFWGLLHPPGSRGILALMQGEAYFRAHTFEALRTIYDTDDRHPDLASEYTSVDLSATVIDANDEFEEDAHEGRGHFRFVGSDEHPYDNRIPRRPDQTEELEGVTGPDEPDAVEARRLDDLANLSRLALAARSTSSLPGGFEPAHVDSFGGAAGEPDVAEERGMRFAFAAHREQAGTPYRIVDGAVFDNVPIDRALRAARSRTSDRKADRAMLFLDPEPDQRVGGAFTWDEHTSRFFRAIGAMLFQTAAAGVGCARGGRPRALQCRAIRRRLHASTAPHPSWRAPRRSNPRSRSGGTPTYGRSARHWPSTSPRRSRRRACGSSTRRFPPADGTVRSSASRSRASARHASAASRSCPRGCRHRCAFAARPHRRRQLRARLDARARVAPRRRRVAPRNRTPRRPGERRTTRSSPESAGATSRPPPSC